MTFLRLLLLSHGPIIALAFLSQFKTPLTLHPTIKVYAQNNQDSDSESPFFFASIASDNNATAKAVVGTAAIVGGTVALSEGATTTAVISGSRVGVAGGSLVAARTAAVGSASGVVASSVSSTSGGVATTSVGRSIASGATAIGSIATTRTTTTATTIASAGIIAGDISSSSIETGVIGSALESGSSTTLIADGSLTLSSAITGSEEYLAGDVATDAILSAAGDSISGVGADSILFATGEAGAAALSVVPGWLLSTGLTALLSELFFAILAFFVLVKAGSNITMEAVSNIDDIKEGVSGERVANKNSLEDLSAINNELE